MKLTLLLPAKDEAENLPGLVRPALEAGYRRVVVCDDGSTDGTAAVAEGLGALVLVHPRNLGLAAALRTLLNWAAENLEDDDLAVFMDADGTMDPRSVAAARALFEGGAEIAIGSRYAPGGGVSGLPAYRAVLSLGARELFRLLHPIPGVRDYTSGYRVYRADFLRRYREAYPDWFAASGFTAQTELLLRARTLVPPPRVEEFPIRIRYEAKRGASKMRVLRTIAEYARLALAPHVEKAARAPRRQSR